MSNTFRQALAAKDEEAKHAKEECARFKNELATLRAAHVAEKAESSKIMRELRGEVDRKIAAMAEERAELLAQKRRWQNRSLKIGTWWSGPRV